MKRLAVVIGLLGGLGIFGLTNLVNTPVAKAGCGAYGQACTSDFSCSGGFSQAVCRRFAFGDLGGGLGGGRVCGKGGGTCF
jgi:hypothetical protein